MDLNKKIESLVSVLGKLSKEVEQIKKSINGNGTSVAKETPVAPSKPIETPAAPEENKENTPASDFEQLKNLLNSDKWPPAVHPSLICNLSSEQDKQERAEGILDLIIDIHLENLTFLDFGCGEGHVINKCLDQNPKMAVGYDVAPSERWDTHRKGDNILFTTDWKKVEESGPYNVILIYDVLDHMSLPQAEVIEELKKIKKLLAPNGKIYVRTHPWSSRHATHLYHDLNKAFVHLVFTPEELKELGYENGLFCREIIHPIRTYNALFDGAGLKRAYGPQNLKENVEPFFVKNQLIANRIKRNWKPSDNNDLKTGKAFPTQQCEIQFVDYILTE